MGIAEILFRIFEIVGTVAFAVSGAMAGIRHGMDVFGVGILGLVTAVGGGVIRDLVLGVTPPAAFLNPTYGILAILVSLITFAVAVVLRKRSNGKSQAGKVAEIFYFFADTIGLAAFTVSGIRVSLAQEETHIWLTVFVGVITGVGGGVLRDVLACTVPAIFRRHIYATASIVGALASTLLMPYFGFPRSSTVGFFLVVVLRFLAMRFRWNYPSLSAKSSENEG